MSYPRSGYKSRGARAVAEAGYQRAKARGEAGPTSRPYAERPAPGPNPYNKSGGPMPMNDGTSRGQLVPQGGKVRPKGGHINGTYRVVKEISIPHPDRTGQFIKVGLSAKMLRLLRLAGLNPGAAFFDAAAGQFLGLFARGQNPDVLINSLHDNFGQPIHIVWAAGGVSHVRNESNTTKDTRQTGQSFGSNPGAWNHNITIGSSGYFSTWQARKISAISWRMDELVTYGPLATGTRGWVYTAPGSWTGTLPGTVPYPFVNVKPGVEIGPPPVVTPPPPRDLPWVPRGPPGPGVKERKITGPGKLIQLLNAATETVDIMEALFDALPDDCKAEYRRKTTRARREYTRRKRAGNTPKGPLYNKASQTLDKAQAVYKCFPHIDVDTAVYNIIKNHVEDEIYGRLGLRGVGRYGGSAGANKLLNEAFGDAQRDLLGQANQQIRDKLNSLGFSIQG